MIPDKYRVLVIDDERDILDLIHMTLSPQFDVVALQDPVEALEIADLFEPDVVVVDIMMPKITGYQVIESLKQNPKFQHVVIVVLSAKDTSRDIKYGYKLGANLYLTKPFHPDRLLKNVQMLTGAMGKPRARTYSMRDIQLRMQLKVGHHISTQYGSSSTITPSPDSAPPSQQRLKRPLAQEAEEQEKKRWVD
jgi:DNA-binding response OmpR family regulator